MTAEFEGAEIAARQIRRFDPGIRIVFGGQHPTIVTGEVLAKDYCDFVCIGEGEETFGHPAASLGRGRRFVASRGTGLQR